MTKADLRYNDFEIGLINICSEVNGGYSLSQYCELSGYGDLYVEITIDLPDQCFGESIRFELSFIHSSSKLLAQGATFSLMRINRSSMSSAIHKPFIARVMEK
jgi:hypothetical protein